MYTKKQFGNELKKMILNHEPIYTIGSWAHDKYYENISNIDLELGELLLQFGTMEIGHEFSRSYEELESIADRLIAGKDVKL